MMCSKYDPKQPLPFPPPLLFAPELFLFPPPPPYFHKIFELWGKWFLFWPMVIDEHNIIILLTIKTYTTFSNFFIPALPTGHQIQPNFIQTPPNTIKHNMVNYNREVHQIPPSRSIKYKPTHRIKLPHLVFSCPSHLLLAGHFLSFRLKILLKIVRISKCDTQVFRQIIHIDISMFYWPGVFLF